MLSTSQGIYSQAHCIVQQPLEFCLVWRAKFQGVVASVKWGKQCPREIQGYWDVSQNRGHELNGYCQQWAQEDMSIYSTSSSLHFQAATL